MRDASMPHSTSGNLPTRKGFKFASWLAVVHYCETHAWIYYHAPLDLSPVVAAVRMVYKNGKVKLNYHGNKFTIDAGHLDRCSYPENRRQQ